MDDAKREELEKACKKEKGHRVRARMVAVRMVRVFNMIVDETADIQGRIVSIKSLLRQSERNIF